MRDFVVLELRRNRGWPWPEDSLGLTPMFGEDGRCRACGIPLRDQSGSIVLERRGFDRLEGAWVPHWRFDAYCLEQSLAENAARRFKLQMRPVAWHGARPGGAMQIVVASVGSAWFDPDELRERTRSRHGASGATCGECGIWRWLPLAAADLPSLRVEAFPEGADIAASPEWFGDGRKAFRQILVRRQLAELLAEASPRDFVVREYPSVG